MLLTFTSLDFKDFEVNFVKAYEFLRYNRSKETSTRCICRETTNQCTDADINMIKESIFRASGKY